MKNRFTFIIFIFAITVRLGLGIALTHHQKTPIHKVIVTDSNQISESMMPFDMKRLFDAYKPYIRSVVKDINNGKVYFIMNNDQHILWSNGTHSYHEKINSPSLVDMMSQAYPAESSILIPPQPNFDPGRYRNQAFLQSVYGSNKRKVKNNLVKVRWMPKTMDKPTYILFNSHNNAAKALQQVSNDLDKLPKSLKKYVTQLAGTFNWRIVAGTHYLSAHSYGIAIDINTDYSNYWLWDNKNNVNAHHLKYTNQIPKQIITIFEKHGFIWGGRWYHYDTMHFEYRPELTKPQPPYKD